MPRFMDDELKELLERLHDKYNRSEFIEDDPISVPHRYTDRADREIAGFLAATIAWGNRRAIVTQRPPHDALHGRRSARTSCAMLPTGSWRRSKPMSTAPSTAATCAISCWPCAAWTDASAASASFSRSAMLPRRVFRRSFPNSAANFSAADHAPRCEKHLSSIDRGAACKRLCMFLRWMVRRDERGVDFGQWTRIPMSALYIPLDLHTGDMARALGLLSRRQNDWRAVEEVTAALRGFDPADPVRYDFSLFGAGIDGYLKEC